MKRSVFIIGGVILIVLLIAGVGYQRAIASTASANTATQTVKVTRGSLSATVSASGNVSAPSTTALAFSSSGKVAQVAVKVGDAVKKGQLLMKLDTTDLDLALRTAQGNLMSAQASYDATQVSLQYALKTAQTNLASAQASYDSAKANNATNADQLVVAKAALDKAQVALDSAQQAYNAVAWRPDIGMTTQSATLQSATSEYQSALATYKITAASINDTALRTAQASLNSAQIALEQAQKNVDTSTRSAQATLDSAKIAVTQAQRNLDNASLYAPYDGLVSAVNFNAGDTASGTAVSVFDTSKLEVKLSIAEVDMAKVAVGETAEMTLDALAGKTYTATVTAIAPVGTVSSGVVNYPVTVNITNPDGDIKPGMTATLAVQVDHRDNVLLIPTRAVKTQNNQKVVNVLVDGKTVQKQVQTGLSSDTMIEVTKGLSEGDEVVVSGTTTTSSNRAMGGLNILGIGGAGGPPPQ